MKRILFGIVFCALLLSLGSVSTAAQAAPMGAAQAPPPDLNLRAQVLANLTDTGDKLVKLAEAIPAEKYSWRPAPGVRSVSEVFLHVTGGNFLFMSRLGATVPADFPRDAEKTITDKAKVVEWLKKSVDMVKTTIAGLSDADMTKAVQGARRPNNYQGVLLTTVSHMHEHLGQSIAYARSNGIAPPWSQQ